jgi:hypothetical protein
MLLESLLGSSALAQDVTPSGLGVWVKIFVIALRKDRRAGATFLVSTNLTIIVRGKISLCSCV